jgi:hypothetical protein
LPLLLGKQNIQVEPSSAVTLQKKYFIICHIFIQKNITTVFFLISSQLHKTYTLLFAIFFLENVSTIFSRSPHGHHTGCLPAQARRAAAPFFLVFIKQTTRLNRGQGLTDA